MTPDWQDRTPNSHKPVAQLSRSPISQWTLLAVAVLSGCLALIAAIERMMVPGLIALVIALAAGILSLAGVSIKPRRREQPRPSKGVSPKVPNAPIPVKPEAPGAQDYRFPDPPVFSRASASGQAPWHLPVGTAPSGLAADAARLGDLEVRAASMVGAGHRCQEPADPRQDAYALGRTPDGQFLIIAVADGVSTEPTLRPRRAGRGERGYARSRKDAGFRRSGGNRRRQAVQGHRWGDDRDRPCSRPAG